MARQAQPYSLAQSDRKTNAGSDQMGKCQKIIAMDPDRTCLCAPKEPFRPVHWHRWQQTGAEAKLTLSNLAYNFDRLLFEQRRGATG